MSEQDKWRYETDGAARAEFSAITEAREQSEVEVLKKRIAELENALSIVKSDLLMRGEKDSQGCIVVNLGNSAWHVLNKALKEHKDND